MISADRTGNCAEPFLMIRLTSVATALGLVPNTAECILTPAGIPRIGISCGSAVKMSQAVPSPPEKSIKATRLSTSLCTALIVSDLVVLPIVTSMMSFGVMPSFLHVSSPISPEQVMIENCLLKCFRGNKAFSVRDADSFFAPRSIACATTAAPSVPLRPAFPPIPAIGLIIRPIFIKNVF